MSELVKAGKAKVARDPWFEQGFYSMQSDAMLSTVATSDNLTPQTRVLLLAQARMNRWGHCPFDQGELFALVGKKDSRTVVKAIDAFKQAGIFSPDSSPLCIALAGRIYRRKVGTSQHCIERRHFNKQERMWIDPMFGWEEHPGQWHENMASPERKAAIASGEMTGWQPMATVTELEVTGKLDGTVRLRQATVPIAASGVPCWKCGGDTRRVMREQTGEIGYMCLAEPYRQEAGIMKYPELVGHYPTGPDGQRAA
jgi:hypothetical protein